MDNLPLGFGMTNGLPSTALQERWSLAPWGRDVRIPSLYALPKRAPENALRYPQETSWGGTRERRPVPSPSPLRGLIPAPHVVEESE